MEECILISYLNDFIFCPISIYFHRLYGALNKILYHDKYQIKGLNAHKSIDNKTYSTRKEILQGIEVYSQNFGIQGKIDIYNVKDSTLIERKNKIITIYDGYIFQLYAQYYCLTEMEYIVKKIKLYSIEDNKNYNIKLPHEDPIMNFKFKQLIADIRSFNPETYLPTNEEKCNNCIYEPLCDRSLKC